MPRDKVDVAKRVVDAYNQRDVFAQDASVSGVVWGYDDAEHVAESIYLFDTDEQARAWGDGPMKSALGSHPGISDIEVRYYDVDERLSAVTRAPLALTAHA